MYDWLSARVQATPHRIFLKTVSGQWTFHQIHSEAYAYAANLREFDIQPGDKVAFVATNQQQTVVLIFALMRLGAVLVPINARLTQDEVAYQLHHTDSVLLIADDAYFADKVFQMPTVTLSQLSNLSGSRHHEEDTPPINLDSPFMIVHTSGTSGQPKGAVLAAGNVFYSAMASAYRLGHLPDDVWLCTLPLYHVGGLSIILRACLYGITVDLRERFDIDAVNHALTHEGVTVVSLVPTMLYRLLDHRTAPWSDKLRLVLLGGAAASPQLMQRCLDENIPVATTYGLSEAASQVATATPDIAMHKPGTVGKPLMFTQVKVVDSEGHPQSTGDYGEVVVSGPTVMQGYYNNPEATARTLRDGWLHTGDIGYLDEDGDLWLVQRRSDLIVTGGENVYPAEVENVIRAHPAVKEVAVIGIDDPEWGQRVVAAVQVQPGQFVTEDEIITYSREHLAGYKQPRVVLFVDELPQTGSGKIQRRDVVKLFER